MGATHRRLATPPHLPKSVAVVLLSFVVAIACASPAWSAGRVEKSNVLAEYAVPPCDDLAVFARIAAEFGGRHWAFGAVRRRARSCVAPVIHDAGLRGHDPARA